MTPTWPIAAGSMVLAFAVADVTGVRPLGGLVLVLAGAWCAQRWRPRIGLGATIGLLAFWLGCFVASHALADVLGTWGAVLSTASAVGAAVWTVSDRAARRGGGPASARASLRRSP